MLSHSSIMKNQEASIIDLGNSSDDVSHGFGNVASQLQFQDFPRNLPSNSTTVSNFSNVEDNSIIHDEEDDQLLQTGKTTAAFWELAYFAKYFDVTTRDVLLRILWSILPIGGSSVPGSANKNNYIERHIQTNPDLYGPIWINITLIFTIAICGNIATYLSSSGEAEWHYDFNKVGLAASTVTVYTLAVPTILWFFFWFRGCTYAYTLLETICAYGYSLSVYIPISILWMFGIKLIQYCLVIAAAMLSGSVLVLSFAPVVQSDPSQTVKFSYIFLLVIIAMHSLVAFTFLVYFF